MVGEFDLDRVVVEDSFTPRAPNVERSGLASYGANYAAAYRQLDTYAAKILRGAKPAELPIDQATKFELIVNSKTAKVLDLTIPGLLLARTDEVIE